MVAMVVLWFGSPAIAADAASSVGMYGNHLLVTAPAVERDPTIDRLLRQRISVEFDAVTLTDVADFLRKTTTANIVVAPEAIEAAGVVTLKVSDMALGNVIDWVAKLAKVHIGYRDEAIYFSLEELPARLETRSYDVSDLRLAVRNFPGPDLDIPDSTGQGSRLMAPLPESTPAPSEDELVDLVKKQVRPTGGWRE